MQLVKVVKNVNFHFNFFKTFHCNNLFCNEYLPFNYYILMFNFDVK